MKSRTFRAAAAALVGFGLVAAAPTEAQANDVTLKIYYGGVLKALGTYDDLTDNLCITVYGSSQAWGEIAFSPVEGTGWRGTSAANSGGAGKYCTGNLSIPEDRLCEIQMRWESATHVWRYTEKKTFYT